MTCSEDGRRMEGLVSAFEHLHCWEEVRRWSVIFFEGHEVGKVNKVTFLCHQWEMRHPLTFYVEMPWEWKRVTNSLVDLLSVSRSHFVFVYGEGQAALARLVLTHNEKSVPCVVVDIKDKGCPFLDKVVLDKAVGSSEGPFKWTAAEKNSGEYSVRAIEKWVESGLVMTL